MELANSLRKLKRFHFHRENMMGPKLDGTNKHIQFKHLHSPSRWFEICKIEGCPKCSLQQAQNFVYCCIMGK